MAKKFSVVQNGRPYPKDVVTDDLPDGVRLAIIPIFATDQDCENAVTPQNGFVYFNSTAQNFRKYTNGVWSNFSSAGKVKYEIDITANGQTLVNLPVTPSDPSQVDLIYGGFTYHNISHFIISGSVLTWLGTPVFQSGEKIYVLI